MIIRNCSHNELFDRVGDRRLICFGAGVSGRLMCESHPKEKMLDRISVFVDNDRDKHGGHMTIFDTEVPIVGPKWLENSENVKNSVILVTSRFWDQIFEQLDKIVSLSSVECYSDILLKINPTRSGEEDIFGRWGEELIPRKIHYCWFGGGALPDSVKRCMDSWEKFCPDFEIIRWDESNYNINKNRFTSECVGRHWSALASYARLDILYTYGGIYFDTDVEIVRDIIPLLRNRTFFGFEVGRSYVNTGHGAGSVPGVKVFRENMEEYEKRSFLDENGKWADYIPSPILTTEVLKHHGLIMNGEMQEFDGITVYPNDYFDPALQMPSARTYSIHRYSSLWSFSGKNMQEIWEKQRIYYQKLKKESRL